MRTSETTLNILRNLSREREAEMHQRIEAMKHVHTQIFEHTHKKVNLTNLLCFRLAIGQIGASISKIKPFNFGRKKKSHVKNVKIDKDSNVSLKNLIHRLLVINKRSKKYSK